MEFVIILNNVLLLEFQISTIRWGASLYGQARRNGTKRGSVFFVTNLNQGVSKTCNQSLTFKKGQHLKRPAQVLPTYLGDDEGDKRSHKYNPHNSI